MNKYILYFSIQDWHSSWLEFNIKQQIFDTKSELDIFVKGMILVTKEIYLFSEDYEEKKLYYDENRDMLVYQIYQNFLNDLDYKLDEKQAKTTNPIFIKEIENKDSFLYCEEEVCYKLKEKV